MLSFSLVEKLRPAWLPDWANSDAISLDANVVTTSAFRKGVLLAIVLGLIYLALLKNFRNIKVPLLLDDEIGSSRLRALEYCFKPKEVMWKGYVRFPNQVYGMNTQDGVKVVIPAEFLDALKSHPHLSFKASIDNDMQVDYTYFGGPPEHVITAIKGGMTASLPRFVPVLQKMVQKNMPSVLGVYKEWTPIKVHDRILKLAGTNNARVFLGTSASKDEEWVAASTGYVLSVFDCIRALKQWNPMLRPFIHRFLRERAAISQQWAIGRKRVQESMRERKAKGGNNLEDPPSMLDYLSSGKNAHLANDVEKQILYQMTLVAVGTVTTFASITQSIYDLAAYPQYIAELREEIMSVPKDVDGHYTRESLSAMKKLDNFIKESQRLSMPDLSTFQRAATADMTLPDGTFIPKGTKLEVNTCSIHVDEDYYSNPSVFDGFRFYRLRQQEGEENKHLYYSVGKNDLSFGYGRHACPGRYLGHLNIKLTLAELLLNYDLKLPPGVGRPKNLDFEAISGPDPEFEILMKSRNLR